MSAKSRKPDTESLGIESNSVLASSRLQTGVLPFLTTYFGPRTACAGFDGVIWRTTRKSYNIRTAASFCLTVGLDPGKSSRVGVVDQEASLSVGLGKLAANRNLVGFCELLRLGTLFFFGPFAHNRDSRR